MEKQPNISVVIPTRNGGKPFRTLLHALFKEQTLPPHEVIVIDQNSTDGTDEEARKYPARLISIDPSEFGHGRTRNQGARLSGGDYIVFLNQDAVPASPEWLHHLVRPLEEDERLAGVYGRQLPNGSNPCEAFSLNYTYPEIPRRHTANEISRFSVFHILFSDVNACIRKSVWEQFPLNESLNMSEDQEWAFRVLKGGHALFYEPKAAVFHSNHYTLSRIFRRSFEVGISHETFPRPAWYVVLGRSGRFFLEEMRHLARMRRFGFLPYGMIWESARASGFLLGRMRRLIPAPLEKRFRFYPLREGSDGKTVQAATCPLCRSTSSRFVCLARDELMDRGDRIYRYLRCLSCETVYLHPFPAPSHSPEIYREDYPAWAKNRMKYFFRKIFMDIPQIRFIRRFKRSGSLLDVGCGVGTLLGYLKEKGGWHLEGLEPSPFGCRAAKEMYGLSLKQGTLDQAHFPGHSFDVVTLWDVLEHVEDPRALLRNVRHLLKKEGILLLSLPNVGSIDFSLFKGRWHFLTAPYHFCLIPVERMRDLFREEGWKVVVLRTTFLSLYESLFCSLQLCLREGKLGSGRGGYWFRISLGLLACLLATPLFLMAHPFKKGGRMVVAARPL